MSADTGDASDVTVRIKGRLSQSSTDRGALEAAIVRASARGPIGARRLAAFLQEQGWHR